MLLRWWQPALLAVALCGVSTVGFAADPAPVVYVADFDLDAANVQPDSGPGGRLRRLGGILPGGPLRPSKDPQTHAKEIVAEMADALTGDLKKAGLDARRVTPGQVLPNAGWEIRGVFLSVDEGNRLQRAIVGFGAGQSNFQVAVSLDDLSTPDLPPLYEATEESAGKDKPGAFIKLNPYVVAAKFVMAGQDEKATIKSTASQISDAIVAQLKAKAH